MAKESKSWSKNQGSENQIAVKRVDWSIFEYGIHIPIEYRPFFEEANNSQLVPIGESIRIAIVLNDVEYGAELRAINQTVEEDIEKYQLQIRYDKNRGLRNELKDIFANSFYYIMRERRSVTNQEKVSILVPDEEAEFIEIEKTGEPFKYHFNVKAQKNNYWIFQCNPGRYDIKSALANDHVTKWTVSAHKDRIQPKDKIIFWVTGSESGCYALGKVLSAPHMTMDDEQERQYYSNGLTIDESLRCDVGIEINLAHNPIFKNRLTDKPEFQDFKGGNQGTNFVATREQYFSLMDMTLAEVGGLNMYESFLEHIGGKSDLRNYQKSYKMVMLIEMLKHMDQSGKIKAIDLARKCKEYYENRVNQNLSPDYEVSTIISRIKSSSVEQVLTHFKGNPFQSFNRHGFIDLIDVDNGEFFSLHQEIIERLTDDEKQRLIDLLNQKLAFYYATQGQSDKETNNTSFRDLLTEIMSRYVQTRNYEPFGGNELARKIRSDVPDLIIRQPFIDKSVYDVKGGPGQGNWAKVPWIAIFNQRITTTIQNGVYIVYLFSEDMSRLYITLNQGYTQTYRQLGRSAAIDYMQEQSQRIRRLFQNIDPTIKLNCDVSIGNEYYEKGTIAHKLYEVDQLPTDDELFSDLEEFMKLYENYYLWIQKTAQELKKDEENEEEENEVGNEVDPIVSHIDSYSSVKGEITRIGQYISNKGFSFEKGLIENLYLCLKSKPFVLLAGTSGTGKTKLIRLFAEAIGATVNNGRFKMVPVKPDWSDATDLLGYRDLNGRFHPGVLTNFVIQASENPLLPHFMCLDEMNLARVEYYFSDILSILETREIENEGVKIITDPLISKEYLGTDPEVLRKFQSLRLPENLYFVGTVNMDESTFPFSKKVLDRANTIEFSYVDLNLPDSREGTDVQSRSLPNQFLKSRYLILNDCLKESGFVNEVIQELTIINNKLMEAQLHFGYRIRDEICFYTLYNKESQLLSFEEAIDRMILQKILPRIQGSSPAIKRALLDIFKICINDSSSGLNPESIIHPEMEQMTKGDSGEKTYIHSAIKLTYMMRRFEEDGFTSFWI
jgi:5-methylcytosine-specific restriction enzyme B